MSATEEGKNIKIKVIKHSTPKLLINDYYYYLNGKMFMLYVTYWNITYVNNNYYCVIRFFEDCDFFSYKQIQGCYMVSMWLLLSKVDLLKKKNFQKRSLFLTFLQ